LQNKTPVDYLIEEGVLSQMCLTYTGPCQDLISLLQWH
jgi:hypothetical protein